MRTTINTEHAESVTGRNVARIRWGRIVVAACALEAALFAVLLPLQPVLSPRMWLGAVAICCALFSYGAGWVAARRLQSGALVHGLLVGVLATSLYIALNMAQPGGVSAAVAFYGGPLFALLNLLRIAGCAIGALRAPAAIHQDTVPH